MKFQEVIPESNSVELRAFDLPSKGNQYPQGTIFRIRPYKLGEVLKINSSSIDEITKLEIILSGVEILNSDLTHDEITGIDLDAIALTRLSLSSDLPNLTYVVKCPNCNSEQTVTVNLDDIRIESVDYKPITIHDLSFGLPVVGRIKEFASQNFQTDEELYLALVATYCLTPRPLEDVIKEFEEFSMTEYNQLKSFIESLSKAGIQPIKTTCDSCKNEFEFVPEVKQLPL